MKVATLFSRAAFENSAHLALASLGADVTCYRDVDAFIATVSRRGFDAAVLEDVDPALSNWLAMLQIHSVDYLPIIVTGSGGAGSICRALSHGADDYAVMIEGSDALAQRVEAQVYLRHRRQREAVLRVGDCTLNAETKLLTCGAESVCLTGREFSLAWTLFESAGRVVTLRSLSMQVWGKSVDISKRTIEQHVYKLRRKLECGEPCGGVPLRIETVYGVGYRLEEAREGRLEQPHGGVLVERQ